MIPTQAHFIWIGQSFPWLCWAALASAAKRGEFERVTLHHTDPLDGFPYFRELERIPGVYREPLDPERTLEQAFGPRLVDRYRSLEAPAAKSNMLRVALLHTHGGVYLDADTVTVKSFAPLCSEAGFFCGTEHIAFPAALDHSCNPLAWAGALARSALRDIIRRQARGALRFARVQHRYPRAVNNAVLGATPGHPFLRELAERMLALPDSAVRRRYALGTSLLQHALAEAVPRDAVIHPPALFYPLAPEISEHWFRIGTGTRLSEVLSPATRLVHWYASVRTRSIVPRIDSRYVTENAPYQLLSALLSSALELS